MPTPRTSAPDRGPNAAHVLLSAIKGAMAADVPVSKIIPIVDMAISANGTLQSPVWKSCSAALDTYAREASPSTP